MYFCTMKNHSNKDIENILEGKGVKPTANRIIILREFLNASHPLTLADLELLSEFSLDKATIFRTLELFTQKDVVHVIEDGSRSFKYELCHGGVRHSVSDQHVHFYCENCKELFCLEDVQIPLVQVPEGFITRSVNYMIKGICPKCSLYR